MNATPEQVTEVLEAADAGDAQAAEQLLPLVYDELRRLAAAKMARETPGQTLQPTALVHEAWLRLVGGQVQNCTITDRDLGLINMRGRMYDPKIGRSTPDPIVQDPLRGESLNRYSYAWNNPSKWVDPSGFDDEPPAASDDQAPPGQGVAAQGVAAQGDFSYTVTCGPDCTLTVTGPSQTSDDQGQSRVFSWPGPTTFLVPREGPRSDPTSPGNPASVIGVLNGITGAAVDLFHMITAPQEYFGSPEGRPKGFPNPYAALKSALRIGYPEGTPQSFINVQERLSGTLFNVALGYGLGGLSEAGAIVGGIDESAAASVVEDFAGGAADELDPENETVG